MAKKKVRSLRKTRKIINLDSDHPAREAPAKAKTATITLWRDWMDARTSYDFANRVLHGHQATSERIVPRTEIWKTEERSMLDRVDALSTVRCNALNNMQEQLKSDQTPMAIAVRLHAALMGILPWRPEIISGSGVEGELLLDALRDLSSALPYEMFAVIYLDLKAANCLGKDVSEL